jgi:hypothetical protein
MLKIILIAVVPIVCYCVLTRFGFRRHADRISELALRVVGLSFLPAIVLLAGKVPGSVQLADTLGGFMHWLHC